MDAMEIIACRKGQPHGPELLSVVQSQFRTFELLEVHLQRPRFFIDQCFFPLPLEIKRTLLELYYTFDAETARELLDKKMSSRGRRDLDEICAQTGQPLASIRRQFETFRRVQRRVEELPGDLCQNIQRKFLLSRSTSAKHAAIALLTKHRIEVGRRRLPVSTAAVMECAEAFFQNLTLPSKTVEFDYLLAMEIRELRQNFDIHSLDLEEIVSSVEKSHAEAIQSSLTDESLQSLMQHCLHIGSGISQAKEVRALCIEINDGLARPLAASGLPRPSIEALFEAIYLVHAESAAWRRLITALKVCTISILYS